MTAHAQSQEVSLTVADEAQVSSSFQLPSWVVFLGIYIPDIDAATVSVQVSRDDTTFVPVLDQIDGDDLVVVNSGSDPGFVDISPFLAAVPREWYVRFYFSAAQNGGPYTLYVGMRG